jgi:ribosomal protein S27AE
MDTNEAASWVHAERLERSRKKTKEKLKNVKWTTISIKVPICPKCNNSMRQELDSSARELWKWVCSKCGNTI